MTSPTSMTQSAALKVPTPQQCLEARNHLKWAFQEAAEGGRRSNRAYNREEMLRHFNDAASALGFRLSADEPAAQQPQSDLVRRLWAQVIADAGSNTPQTLLLREALDRIEALEAALTRIKNAPDPLGEALNSGDGVYRS